MTRPALTLHIGGKTDPPPVHSRAALPPCDNQWDDACTPGYGTPGPHRCWMWTGWPHICHCLRCGGPRFVLGGRP